MIWPFKRRQDAGVFQRAVQAYGLSNCAALQDGLALGLPARQAPHLRRLRSVPGAPDHVSFLVAPDQLGLLHALLEDPAARSLKALAIGTSHAYPPSGPHDFSAMVAALKGHVLPEVTDVALGEMMPLFNAEMALGSLGVIDHVFEVFPALETLALYGYFRLLAPHRHTRLRVLEGCVDDMGVTGGALSQNTVTHLLSSDLPALERVDLDFEVAGQHLSYDLPDSFVARAPALAVVWVTPLTETSAARLVAARAPKS